MILIIKFPVWYITMVEYFRRNKVYASWKLDKASISVNRGSHFQVHFVWQVWDCQLSPAFKSIRLKAFGGWKFDRGTAKLHARILRGKGVQKKKPNMFTVGSSTSATFALPVYVIRVHEWLVVLEHGFYFSIYWECHHPNWLSYFSEGWLNHRSDSWLAIESWSEAEAMGEAEVEEDKQCMPWGIHPEKNPSRAQVPRQ